MADDDEDDISLFKEVLAEVKSPCELNFARDGIKVLNLINEAPVPDLVILDINMPRKNGFECLEEIKTLPNSNEIPVVFLSTTQNVDASSD